MRKSFKDIVFDRALILDNPEDIKSFSEAPVKFLEDSGAMEGLEEFNGIWTPERERLDSDGRISESSLRDRVAAAREIYRGGPGKSDQVFG